MMNLKKNMQDKDGHQTVRIKLIMKEKPPRDTFGGNATKSGGSVTEFQMKFEFV